MVVLTLQAPSNSHFFSLLIQDVLDVLTPVTYITQKNVWEFFPTEREKLNKENLQQKSSQIILLTMMKFN